MLDLAAYKRGTYSFVISFPSDKLYELVLGIIAYWLTVVMTPKAFRAPETFVTLSFWQCLRSHILTNRTGDAHAIYHDFEHKLIWSEKLPSGIILIVFLNYSPNLQTALSS